MNFNFRIDNGCHGHGPGFMRSGCIGFGPQPKWGPIDFGFNCGPHHCGMTNVTIRTGNGFGLGAIFGTLLGGFGAIFGRGNAFGGGYPVNTYQPYLSGMNNAYGINNMWGLNTSYNNASLNNTQNVAQQLQNLNALFKSKDCVIVANGDGTFSATDKNGKSINHRLDYDAMYAELSAHVEPEDKPKETSDVDNTSTNTGKKVSQSEDQTT